MCKESFELKGIKQAEKRRQVMCGAPLTGSSIGTDGCRPVCEKGPRKCFNLWAAAVQKALAHRDCVSEAVGLMS